MEITNMTFVTLATLCVLGLYFVYLLLKSASEHEKRDYTTLNKPLQNSNKSWHNR